MTNEKMGQPPMPVEWHDNLEAVEAESNLVDVTNILLGNKRVLEVKTSKGSLLFKKISEPKRLELADKYKNAIEATLQLIPSVMSILSKENEREYTNEDWTTLAEFGIVGRPWTYAIAHASLVKPRIDLDTFYSLMEEFPADEALSIVNTVANIYNPPEEAKRQAKRYLTLASRFGLPIGEGLTLQNAPADLIALLDEADREEHEEMLNALKR